MGKRYAMCINGNATFVMQDLLQWGGRFMSHVARTTTRWISTNASPRESFFTKKSRNKEKGKGKEKIYENRVEKHDCY